MNERIHLDWNATAPLRKEARAAALAALDLLGNPSSVHGEGRAARHLIEQAREQVAALVGAAPRNVVFTSGGTEANMSALVPTAARDRLLVSAIEHPSVLAGGRFAAESGGRKPGAADPLVKGGGQEHGLRGGTENVAAIAGFGAAAAAARADLASERTRMAALRERLEARLKAASPEMVIFGAQSERLPNTT